MDETKTVAELRRLAKECGITGRWSMTKSQLIDEIAKVKPHESANDEHRGSQGPQETTLEYIKTIVSGSILAFKLQSKRGVVALSGKVVEVLANGKFVVSTKQGTRFTIEPDDILWVKTGPRWPKWVFTMFNQTCKEVE